MKIRLEFTKGPDLGLHFTLNSNEGLIIGRGGDSKIQMKDGLISREHCEVKCDGKRLLLQDLGSTNHTFVQDCLSAPITPREFHEVPSGTSFFVGPESRCIVTYMHEPQDQLRPPTPQPHGQSSGGNFTASIDQAKFIQDMGDSSVFNLLGPVPTQSGLDTGRRGNALPVPPTPPTPTPPPTRETNSPMPAGYTGSIAPPHLQGMDEPVVEQIGDDAFVDESYLKSTPKVEKVPASKAPETRSPKPPPPVPTHESSFSSSAVQSESIAIPGLIYSDPKPSPVQSVSVDSRKLNPFDQSIDSPHDSSADLGLVSDPPPADDDPLQPDGVPDKARLNGLYFHTGEDLGQLPQLIEVISQNLEPIYCIDRTRLDFEAPPADVAGAFSDEPDLEKTTENDDSNRSAFDLDGDENQNEASVSSSIASETPPVGVPLFDFLPEGMRHNGPVLMTKDELDLPLEAAWNCDAVVVFFGQDPKAMVAHLKELVHINIQNGRIFKGMFGYCWPTVLHATLEGQGKDQVGRIFGDAVTCVLLEDPQQKFAWNLISQKNFSGDLKSLQN